MDAPCCCTVTKAHLITFKPRRADWAFCSRALSPITHTVAHIFLVAAQLNHFYFFFPLLAAERLRWSSLGSATERIKSTRIVAESVLLIQSPRWDFFHPVWGLKPVTFKAHSCSSDLQAPAAVTYLTTMVPAWEFLQIYKIVSLLSSSSLCFSRLSF